MEVFGMKTGKVRWGVLSAARIGGQVIPGIQNATNAEFYGIASRSPEKLQQMQEKYAPQKIYEDYDALLEDEAIDAVYIPLPNGLHKEWVIRAARKGKHVLCEKPLGCSAAEVEEMARECKAQGVLLMEAFAYMHNPLTYRLKELLDAGAIGRVKVMEAWFSFNMSDKRDIRFDKQLGGGATYDVGCYTISLLRYLAGEEPTAIYASGEIDEETGVDASSCAVLEFSGGVKGIYHCAMNAAHRCKYEILGEKGILQVPQGFNASGDQEMFLWVDGKRETIIVPSESNYKLEVEQFSRCILEGETPFYSLQDSYRNARVIDEVLRQIFDGR